MGEARKPKVDWRFQAGLALAGLRKTRKNTGQWGRRRGFAAVPLGPFSCAEVREIIQDVMGLPRPTGLRGLDDRQCRELVLRLIVLGLA